MLKLYAIKDTCVGKYMNPFPMHNDMEAVRAFKQAINSNQKTLIVENYKDMQLVCLGDYNEETGVITSDVRMLANGVDVKEIPQPIVTFDIPPVGETPKEGE